MEVPSYFAWEDVLPGDFCVISSSGGGIHSTERHSSLVTSCAGGRLNMPSPVLVVTRCTSCTHMDPSQANQSGLLTFEL